MTSTGGRTRICVIRTRICCALPWPRSRWRIRSSSARRWVWSWGGAGRFGDAAVERAVAAGVRQLVLLGAGSDPRCRRLALPSDLTAYEVDLPGQLDAKESAFEAAGLVPSAPRRRVDADLRGDWAAALAAAGHDAGRPTVWIAEGLFSSLDRGDSIELLSEIGRLSAAGGRVVFDVPHPAFARDPAKSAFLALMTESGCPWLGFAEHPDVPLPPGAWRLDAYLPPDLVAGRCPWVPPMPQRLADSHRWVWYAHARR
ncbi:class I SAM-dependent methyltransferase [Uniformispora flossi]